VCLKILHDCRYLAYGVSLTAVRCTSTVLAGLILRSTVLPLLYCLLFALAATCGWWRKGRKAANHLLWIVLVSGALTCACRHALAHLCSLPVLPFRQRQALEVVGFVLVPAMTPPNWLSIERQVADVADGATQYYAPDNATFIDGVLAG